MTKAKELFARRQRRTRIRLRKFAEARPRLSVFRSSKQIYAQVIDDDTGRTLAHASSLDKDLKPALKTGSDLSAATAAAEAVANAIISSWTDRRRNPLRPLSAAVAPRIDGNNTNGLPCCSRRLYSSVWSPRRHRITPDA